MNKKYKANLIWVIVSALTYLAAVYVIVVSVLHFKDQQMISMMFIAVAAVLLLFFVKDDLLNLFYLAQIDEENKTLYLTAKWFGRKGYQPENIKKITVRYKNNRENEVILVTEKKEIPTTLWTMKSADAIELTEKLMVFCEQNEIEFAKDGFTAAKEEEPEETVSGIFAEEETQTEAEAVVEVLTEKEETTEPEEAVESEEE